jgi:hypothetical protein
MQGNALFPNIFILSLQINVFHSSTFIDTRVQEEAYGTEETLHPYRIKNVGSEHDGHRQD